MIESNNNLPTSVKQILNNPKLNGIYNVIGKVIEVEEKYSVAISTSLGMASTNIIVENDNYLKYNSNNYVHNEKKAVVEIDGIMNNEDSQNSSKNSFIICPTEFFRVLFIRWEMQ